MKKSPNAILVILEESWNDFTIYFYNKDGKLVMSWECGGEEWQEIESMYDYIEDAKKAVERMFNVAILHYEN